MSMFKIIIDDSEIQVEEDVLKTSLFFFEFLSSVDNSEEKEFRLPIVPNTNGENVATYSNVKKILNIMKLVMEKKIEIEKPMKKNFSVYVDKQIADEFDIPSKDVLNLAVLANFLNVEKVCNLCSAKLADICKKLDTEEIRLLFGIVSDFTPQEEEEIEKQNRWLEKL